MLSELIAALGRHFVGADDEFRIAQSQRLAGTVLVRCIDRTWDEDLPRLAADVIQETGGAMHAVETAAGDIVAWPNG